MQGVEAVRAVEEVGGRLAGTADAAHLDHPVRRDRQFVADVDDAAGDRVVAAALAERRGAALVVALFQPDAVGAGRGAAVSGGAVMTIGLTLLFQDRLGDEPGGQRQAVAVGDRADMGRVLGRVQPHQRAHLAVEVQFHHIDALDAWR